MEKEYHNSENHNGELMTAKIKVDGKDVIANSAPVLVEILTTIPQTVFEFWCGEKKYTVKLTASRRLQMI